MRFRKSRRVFDIARPPVTFIKELSRRHLFRHFEPRVAVLAGALAV